MTYPPTPAAKLRAPFPPEAIGKLPRAATKTAAERGEKGHCNECGKYHVLPAVHLDYVGHAAVTDRLLAVDPAWTWEPLGLDEQGRPALVSGIGDPGEPLGLWIKLTVCGVTRPGFGCGKSAKEAISDAIRNAAMRFGVALDLWSKEDLQASANGDSARVGNSAVTGSAGEPPGEPVLAPETPRQQDRQPATDAQVKALHTLFSKLDKMGRLGAVEGAERMEQLYGTTHCSELSKLDASTLIAKLSEMVDTDG